MDAFDADVLIHAAVPDHPAGQARARPVPARSPNAEAVGGADRFVTDNRSDFPTSIIEVAVTYPEELPDPTLPGGASK